MEQLLSTKFYIPPTRRKLVSRPRLVERINQGLHRKLTLISAPAGFGKTTLVSEWVEKSRSDDQNEFSISWLSLDESDNDPVHFLSYFICAFKNAEGVADTLGDGALNMLQAPQPPPIETILTALINDISALPGKIVLVLDDYHLISQTDIDNALTFLLEHLPPQLHLILSSRVDPHLPLARLRASSQLNELRATDLRFSAPEAVEFLNETMDLALSDEDISSLESRTEGWIAGLQLAAISMQGREDTSSMIKSFTGSHRLVLDYLIEEVLDQQSENVQHFLLHTAVLNRLSGAVCDTLTGQTNSQETLEMLDHANLFIIPLDEERRWYRYHHLFSDLLRQRLHQTIPKQEPELHSLASKWYEQNGFIDEAIEHSIQGKDIERSADLIEKHADVVWERGEHTKLWRWMEKLPNDVLQFRPQLCIFQAWRFYANGQHSAAEESLQYAENALASRNRLAGKTNPEAENRLLDFERKQIRGRADTIRAHLAFFQGNVEAMKRYSLQAINNLPKEDKSWRNSAAISLGDAYSISGDISSGYLIRSEAYELSLAGDSTYTILVASSRLCLTLRMQGKMDELLQICEQQSKILRKSGLAHVTELCFMLSMVAEVLAERNDLEGAFERLREVEALKPSDIEVGVLGWSYHCLMRVFFAAGDYSSVEKYIYKAENIYHELQTPDWIKHRIADWQVKTWLAQNRLEAATKWVSDRALDVNGELTFLNEREYIALARILIVQERFGEATKLLQRLLESHEKSGHVTRTIQTLILQALNLEAQGKTDQAIKILEQALNMAEPRGFIRTFVDEGPPIAKLLLEAVSREVAPEFAKRLLSAVRVPEVEQATQDKSQDTKLKLIEALSQREIEVLSLIAEGLTNQEIAKRLYLSENTVKVHIRNIFGKLNVTSRTQAAIKSKALGVLPSE